MISFVPDTNIRCENCYKHFITYIHIYTYIDADKNDNIAKAMKSGIINRVTCPYCNTEYTYEAPLFTYSQTDGFALISSFGDGYVNVAAFEAAAKISGLSQWKLRRCSFTMECAEKIRIFKSGFDDVSMELVKLKAFPPYRDMKLDDEYIVFDKSDNEYLYFSHRDFTDKIITEHKVPMCEYSLICDINIPDGKWITVDRDRAINFMEDIKK